MFKQTRPYVCVNQTILILLSITVTNTTLLFFGCTCGMWKFLGQGLNSHHSSNQSHSGDNTGSLTCWATGEHTWPPYFWELGAARWLLPFWDPVQITTFRIPSLAAVTFVRSGLWKRPITDIFKNAGAPFANVYLTLLVKGMSFAHAQCEWLDLKWETFQPP